jgi:alkylation response protein AidB-like acyl-CoA dehydrogenase
MVDVEALDHEVREFLDEQWSPDLTVREWWRRFADSGWAMATWPTDVGGKGLSRSEARVVAGAVAAAGALGVPSGLGVLLAAPTIIEHGTSEQKARYLRPLIDGSEAWCQLFSEPGAGSDLASLQCKAERDGDEWVVTGQKVWTTHGHLADLGMLICRTDPDAPKHRGITYFAIKMNQPGIDVRPLREMTGRAMFNEVFLDGARVPDSARIGELNGGWGVANATLAAERAGLGSGGGGGAGAAFPGEKAGMLDQPCSTYLRSNRRGGAAAGMAQADPATFMIGLANEYGRAGDLQVRQRLAELYTLKQVGNWNALRARAGSGRPWGIPGAPNLGKIQQSIITRLTRDLGPAIMGAEGLLTGDDAPRGGVVSEITLFAPGPSIYGGSDEIQKNIIGERVLGLPKEPGVDKNTPFRDLKVGTQRSE